MDNIRVRIVRPATIDGSRVEAGTQLRVSPEDAADMLSTNRAELVDDGDLVHVQKAIRDRDARLLRHAGRAGSPFTEPQWQPVLHH